MVTKSLPTAKIDVATLSEEELIILRDFGEHEGLKLIAKLGEGEISRIAVDATTNAAMTALEAQTLFTAMSRLREALNFLLNAPKRATVELRERERHVKEKKG